MPGYRRLLLLHKLCRVKRFDIFCGERLCLYQAEPLVAYAMLKIKRYLYGDDLTSTTFTTDNGYIRVTEEVGLGYEVDEEKIERYTVEKCVLSAF